MSKRQVYIFIVMAGIIVAVCKPWMSEGLFNGFLAFGAGMTAGATAIEVKESENE